MIERGNPGLAEFLSAPAWRDWLLEIEDYYLFVDSLRWQWKTLWRERIDDKVRAEGIASRGFPDLFVDRGTIIIATRDYKPLSFQEILEAHLQPDVVEIVNPSPFRGGVRKFIREVIMKQEGNGKSRRTPPPKPKPSKDQQLKGGGRGWLHFHM